MTAGRHLRIVVIGASSGIGLATAEQLAAAGVEVVMVSRDPERGTAAQRGVAAQATGAKPLFLAADLSSPDRYRSFATATSASRWR